MPIDRLTARTRQRRALTSWARPRRRTVTLALAPVLLVTLAACGGDEGTLTVTGTAGPAGVVSPTPTPSESKSPSASPTPTKKQSSPDSDSSSGSSGSGLGAPVSNTKGVFSGTRQVRLLPMNSEATFAVDDSLQVGLSEDFGDGSLFVLEQNYSGSTKYLIKTAKLRFDDDPSNETYCLEVVKNGSKPMAIKAEGCDSRIPGQLFEFTKVGKTETDKLVYWIKTGFKNTYLIQDPEGEYAPNGTGATAVVRATGVGDARLSFILPDMGKASLPTLD